MDNNSKNYVSVVKYLRSHRLALPAKLLDPEITDSMLHAGLTVRAIKQVQKVLSKSETKAVIQKYKEGETTYELAREFSYHRTTISAQ